MTNNKNNKNNVLFDPEYVAIKRFDFNLTKLLDKYSEKIPDHVVEQALLLSREEADVLYKDIVGKLQKILRVAEI